MRAKGGCGDLSIGFGLKPQRTARMEPVRRLDQVRCKAAGRADVLLDDLLKVGVVKGDLEVDETRIRRHLPLDLIEALRPRSSDVAEGGVRGEPAVARVALVAGEVIIDLGVRRANRVLALVHRVPEYTTVD